MDPIGSCSWHSPPSHRAFHDPRHHIFGSPHLHPFMNLQQHSHSCQIQPHLLGQVADAPHPLQVALRIQPLVVAPRRLHQPLLLVDAQRPGMQAEQVCGHADHIHWQIISATSHPATSTPKRTNRNICCQVSLQHYCHV